MWQPPRSADGYRVWALSGEGTVPTLRIKDPAYQEKMANIDAALARCDADNPVFYEDEVDIDLNPKLGADWMFRAQQKRVVTPGKNAKHYLAGVLHQGESVNILLKFTQFVEASIEYLFQVFTAHSCNLLLPSDARFA